MGEVFAGRFELVEPIAEGGMGSVWVVRDRRDGGLYAGKVLRQSDASSLLRFMREQATRVVHPHLVTPLAWAGEDDRVVFTMPLVRGGSVATLLGDHGRLPPSYVVALLRQALDGLEAVHAAGLVHRDLTPANLLLEPTGTGAPHLRVTDFGIAAAVDEPRLTRASQVVGSPGYMAPEQLVGADPHPRQDLYSLAVCGLEMLTAVRPPAALQAARDLVADDSEQGPLVALLLTAADPDPDCRPATAEELSARLRDVPTAPDPAGEPPEVFEQLAGPPDPTGAGPGRGLAGWSLVALGVLAALVAVWLLVSA